MWSRVLATVIYLICQACVSCTNIKYPIADVQRGAGFRPQSARPDVANIPDDDLLDILAGAGFRPQSARPDVANIPDDDLLDIFAGEGSKPQTARPDVDNINAACGSYEAFNLTYSEESLIAWKKGEERPLIGLGGTASLHNSLTDLTARTHICGASLISDRYLLTAAHCVAGGARYSISLGRGDLNVNPTPGHDTDIYTIVDYIIHPEYQPKRNAYNNIAILKTDRPVRPYRDTIWPFCLPERSQVFEGLVQIAGWGNVDTGSKTSSISTAFVRMKDASRCESSWRQHAPDQYHNIQKFVYPQGITDQILCAGREGVDACIGDDGGPMIHTNNKGNNILIGIIAERTDCPEYPVTPGFYTNVAYFIDWIYANTGLHDPSQPSLDDLVDGRIGSSGDIKSRPGQHTLSKQFISG